VTPLARIRWWIGLFVAGLVLSGVTAFPLLAEVRWVSAWPLPGFAAQWIGVVRAGLESAPPFLSYGTDWLAFAHLVIALAFIGPWRDPARNVWVIQWGMLCCVAVIPLALIAGPIRGIPFWWQCVDMSFGAAGIIPLWMAHKAVRSLKQGAGGSP
jgi:hypothetical protein